MARWARGTFILLSGLCAVAPALAQSADGSATAYRIGAKDKVRIEVLEDSALNTETRVDELGDIEIPRVGTVRVNGLTRDEARLAVQERLERYLQRATVTLEITEYRAQPITVLGAVARPGPLPFSSRWTLLEAIMEAGGPEAQAGDTIFVTRRANTGLSDQIAISRRDLLDRADPTVDIPLAPNDLVNLAPATKVIIYSMGEFNKAGEIIFQSNERITLLSLLARANGLTDRAADVLIIRRGQTGQEIRISAKKLIAGKVDDVPLHDGDVVRAKESFF